MGDQLINTQDNSSVQLFAGDFPRVKLPVTIASGAGSLTAGTVLGRITASGKYAAYNNSNSDGTETAKLILGDAVDATSADQKATAYASGEFNEAALTGIDANCKIDFEGTAIFIKSIS